MPLFNKPKCKKTKYNENCSLMVFAQDFREGKWLWEGNDLPFFIRHFPPFCCFWASPPLFVSLYLPLLPSGLSSATRTLSCRPAVRRRCMSGFTDLAISSRTGARPAWVSLISTVSWCVISSHGVSVPKLLTAGLKGTQRCFSSPPQGHTKRLHASQSTHTFGLFRFSLWTCLQRVYLVFYA